MSIDHDPSRKITTEQVPHSGVHNNEHPVRIYADTPLDEADRQGLIKVPGSPTEHPVFAPAEAPQHESFWKKKSTKLIGVGVAALTAFGITTGVISANNANHENNVPVPDPKATSETQPSQEPTPEQTTGTGVSEQEIQAELTRLDALAATPETFMKEPLANRLLWRDMNVERVADLNDLWEIHYENYIMNESPSLDDDAQAILNNTNLASLGLSRGFLEDPNDANGNRFTQDYDKGLSFASAYWVVDAENPNSQDSIDRLQRSVEMIKSFNNDAAPLDDNLIASEITDGEPVKIDDKEYPTKIIDAIQSWGDGIDPANKVSKPVELTMTLFTYTDVSGNEKNEWVIYDVKDLS